MTTRSRWGTPANRPQPVGCHHCGVPITNTEIGPMHLTPQGYLAGWLCPLPYMSLATWPAEHIGASLVVRPPVAQPEHHESPVPPLPRRKVPPGWPSPTAGTV